jgi:rubrerythrin
MEGITTQEDRSAIVAELNDLLKLDHDAVQAYGIAIGALQSSEYRRQLEAFRADHERHITELSQLLRSRDATPIDLPHLPSGAFKLALQAIGAAGGDRTVLLAFKANERQVRDKYRRCAREMHPADVTSVLARAAEDETRHYLWVLGTLEDDFGVTADSTVGRAERVVEIAHARMADTLETAERQAIDAVQRSTRGIVDEIRRNPFGSALAAVGAGFLMATLFGDKR